MQQKDIISRLATLAHEQDTLIVSEIGSQAQWLYASGDHDSHLYLSGPMGMGPSVALGVALGNPDRPVLGILGDGSLMMNFGALVTTGTMAPKNLTLALMDNGVYELTGSVPIPGAQTNWPQMITSLPGFDKFEEINLNSNITFEATSGLSFLHAKLEPSEEKAPPFPLSPTEIHGRFLKYLG